MLPKQKFEMRNLNLTDIHTVMECTHCGTTKLHNMNTTKRIDFLLEMIKDGWVIMGSSLYCPTCTVEYQDNFL